MAVIPDHISIRLQHALEIAPKIDEACLRQIDNPKSERLNEISTYVGEMAEAYKAALNNAMWDFAEKKLRTTVPEKEFRKIKYSHDFPIASDATEFRDPKGSVLRHSRILTQICNQHKSIYEYLEHVQSYNVGNPYLLFLKTLRNDATHTIPIATSQVNVSTIVPEGLPRPEIQGDRVIVHLPGRLLVAHTIPCYIKELDVFVSSNRQWIVMWMTIDGETHISPPAFSRWTLREIPKLINEFYALW